MRNLMKTKSEGPDVSEAFNTCCKLMAGLWVLDDSSSYLVEQRVEAGQNIKTMPYRRGRSTLDQNHNAGGARVKVAVCATWHARWFAGAKIGWKGT